MNDDTLILYDISVSCYVLYIKNIRYLKCHTSFENIRHSKLDWLDDLSISFACLLSAGCVFGVINCVRFRCRT